MPKRDAQAYLDGASLLWSDVRIHDPREHSPWAGGIEFVPSPGRCRSIVPLQIPCAQVTYEIEGVYRIEINVR
jgi:hypothetical protein